jgi:hypothetical protein
VTAALGFIGMGLGAFFVVGIAVLIYGVFTSEDDPYEPLPAARVTFTHDELLLSFPRRLRVIRGVLDATGDEAAEADFDWRKDAA